MRDLDMGDVMDDARRMEDHFLATMFDEFDREATSELELKRYKVGAEARGGNVYAIAVTRTIDVILLVRETGVCEGCLDRYGCDMCCPSYDDGLADAMNRDAEEMALGRPLFPNEY